MQDGLAELLKRSPVMPVLTIADEADAVPLARALAEGGIRSVEITLRTPAALAAIQAVSRAVPELAVGAGTVLNAASYEKAVAAGARFCVAPGSTPELLQAARQSTAPFLPGAMTPSEVIFLAEAGFMVQKFFPAERAGGVGMLKSMGEPMANVSFCPTGGVSLANAPTYLALGNVICVGGSWLAPKDAVETRDWQRITQLASEAAALR